MKERHRSQEALGAKKALGSSGVRKVKLERLEEKMTKLLMATVAILTLNIAAANADGYSANPHAPAGIDQSYVSNGSFDWRHKRPYRHVPWYAYSESGNCFVWTPNAYHYACDPNARYWSGVRPYQVFEPQFSVNRAGAEARAHHQLMPI
jgi:hypothetical protein